MCICGNNLLFSLTSSTALPPKANGPITICLRRLARAKSPPTPKLEDFFAEGEEANALGDDVVRERGGAGEMACVREMSSISLGRSCRRWGEQMT